MFKKRANSVLSEYKIFIKLVLRDFERLQKYSTKSVSLGSPNKALNCEGEILAYKKTSYTLSVFFLQRILTRSVLSGYKAQARDVLSVL